MLLCCLILCPLSLKSWSLLSSLLIALKGGSANYNTGCNGGHLLCNKSLGFSLAALWLQHMNCAVHRKRIALKKLHRGRESMDFFKPAHFPLCWMIFILVFFNCLLSEKCVPKPQPACVALTLLDPHCMSPWLSVAVCVLLEMLLSSPSAYMKVTTEIMLSCLILTWLIWWQTHLTLVFISGVGHVQSESN